jgi:hypothetical protein
MPFSAFHYTGILSRMCGQGGRIEGRCCTGDIIHGPKYQQVILFIVQLKHREVF